MNDVTILTAIFGFAMLLSSTDNLSSRGRSIIDRRKCLVVYWVNLSSPVPVIVPLLNLNSYVQVFMR